MTEAAQPVESGQGAEGNEGSGNDQELYAPFLEGVPEEIHEQIYPALRAQNAEFTRRFQERSERFGPFEDSGVFDLEPETVGNFVNLHGLLNAAAEGDEEATAQVQDWWESVGDALGFYSEDGESDYGEGGESDFDLSDFDPYDPQQMQHLIASQVQEAIAPVGQYLQSREEQEQEAQAIAEAESHIQASLAAIQEDNPDLTEEDMGQIVRLAQLHIGEVDDPIQAGFDEYKALVSKGENSLFDQKVTQPRPAQGQGANGPTPVKVTSDNVAQIARERIEQSMSQ